jgi:hypothetical protein
MEMNRHVIVRTYVVGIIHASLSSVPVSMCGSCAETNSL